MDLHSKLVALLFGIFAGGVHAGYAQATPPAGWSPATTSTERGMFRAAANEAWGAGNTVRTTASMNVGGRAVTMPAAMRMASNAPRFAARAMFGHPLLLLGGLALPYAFEWAQSKGFFWNEQEKRWEKEQAGFENYCPSLSPAEGAEWQAWVQSGVTPGPPGNGCTSVADTYIDADMCKWGRHRVCAQWDGSTRVDARSPFYTKAKLTNPVIIRVPATPQEFEDELAPTQMPHQVPNELPMPLPVELPTLNPTPGTNPQSQPVRVPQGQPQPVPNSNPQQWRQPMTRITPAPTPSNPWQVDVTPEDVVGTDPNGQTDPEPVEEGDPAGEPKESDLCEKNPDILACQKLNLGKLEPVAVPNQNKTLAITKDEGWGPSSAACPAPRTAQVLGMTLSMPFTMLCQFAEAIRPLFIAFAWLSAALTFFGIGRRE
jgi:Neisseria meningitidis TspB protein